MLKYKKLVVSVLLVAIFMASAFSGMADGVSGLESVQVYPEGVTADQAGILTEEASNRIKELIAKEKLVNIDPLLKPYFRSTVRTGFYDDSANTKRAVASPHGASTPEVPVGTTKYTKTYDNSGIFTYRTSSGIYASIANATISLFLGKVEKVGDILSWVYSAVSGAGPDKQAMASAKTMYSYRYTEEQGWVYYFDWQYDYYPRVTVVSRDTCEHYWGQYVDVNGFAKQKTRDFGVRKSENAPHKGNQAWIKSKAKAQWQADLPHYYEDWQ